MIQEWHGTSLYIPRFAQKQFAYLKELDQKYIFRKVATFEYLGNRVPVLIINIKGDSKWKTFQSAEFAYADFASIGKVYALAYVYNESGEGRVARITINSSRLLVCGEIPQNIKDYLHFLKGEK